MQTPKFIATLAVAAVLTVLPLQAAQASTPASVPAVTAKAYKNCTELNKVYKHGVGKPGARDSTSGTPVTNFKRSKSLYNANSSKDRDKDGIACEKA